MYKRQILGVAGLVGAQRTELMEGIFGLRAHTSGRVWIKGEEVNIKQPRDAIRKSVALLTEDRRATGILGVLSVADNISIASLDALRKGPIMLDNKKILDLVATNKEKMAIKVPSPKTQIKSLSGGNQQKVLIARWLANNPDVLILDEPTRGIDAAARSDVYGIIRQLKEEGVAVVDIGGGTSDIAVLSLNGIVCKSSVKMAGNKMNAAIVRYVRSTYNVLIGDSTADRVKREIGTVWTEGQPEKTVEVKGRNLVTGLPQKIALSSYELEMPLRIEVERIITALQSVMEQTPPELVADIEKNGLLMTGGGAMLDGLDKLITSRVRIRAHLAENPIEAVAIGTGKSFEYLGKLYDGFVSYTNYSSR